MNRVDAQTSGMLTPGFCQARERCVSVLMTLPCSGMRCGDGVCPCQGARGPTTLGVLTSTLAAQSGVLEECSWQVPEYMVTEASLTFTFGDMCVHVCIHFSPTGPPGLLVKCFICLLFSE